MSYGLVSVLAKCFYPCNCKNNLILKGASHSQSSVALLAAIGILVLFLVLAEKCIGYIECIL